MQIPAGKFINFSNAKNLKVLHTTAAPHRADIYQLSADTAQNAVQYRPHKLWNNSRHSIAVSFNI